MAHTHPDISFDVSIVSQFLNNSSKEHMEAVYRTLRYLKRDPRGLNVSKKTLLRPLRSTVLH